MPQDGSNNYQYPPGTPGIPDTTIESEAYNTFLDDLVINDLNIPRPVHRGGTGASTADQALINLKAEKAEQVVAAYLSHVWMPGSFRSAIGATDAPVADHAFAGVCYINEPLVYPPTNANVTVEARDMTNSKLYVRQKTAGVWGAWLEQAGGLADLDAVYVNIGGDTMTGSLTLSGPPTVNLHAATKQYVDGGIDGVTGGLASKAPFDAMAYNGMQINGSMEVDQPNAGASIAVPAGSSTPLLIDGWAVNKSGSNAFTVQQVASVFPGYSKELKLTITTAQASIGSNLIRLDNRIEGYRFAKVGWGTAAAQPVTIGFWVKSSVAGNFLVQMSDNTANTPYQTATITTANVAQFITVTVPAQAVWASSTTNGIGALISIYAAFSGLINIAATNGNTFEITGLVVLPGIQAPTAAQSPLIVRPFDQELLTCKRYWQKATLDMRFFASTGTGEVVEFAYPLSPEMRSSPTVTLVAAGSGANTLTFGYSATNNRTLRGYMISANPIVDVFVHDYLYSVDARL